MMQSDIALFAEWVVLAEQRQKYRATPTSDAEKAIAKGEDTLLRLHRAGRESVAVLVHMLRMLYTLKSLGDDAPDLLIESVNRWDRPGGIRCRRGVSCDWG